MLSWPLQPEQINVRMLFPAIWSKTGNQQANQTYPSHARGELLEIPDVEKHDVIHQEKKDEVRPAGSHLERGEGCHYR